MVCMQYEQDECDSDSKEAVLNDKMRSKMNGSTVLLSRLWPGKDLQKRETASKC